MITGLDRVQIATTHGPETIEQWRKLLGAEPVREDTVKALAARRTVLRVGASEVEVLERDGVGAVAEHLSRRGSSLYSVGLATADVEGLRRRLDAHAVHHEVEGDQIFVEHDWLGVPGLRLVLSPATERSPRGLLTRLYEATLLVHDHEAAAARLARVLGLDSAHFTPIRSDPYGYDGTLTLFDPEKLDRIEIVTPFDPRKTMGRFFGRRGPCLYMAYAEADDMARLRERLRTQVPHDWTGGAEGPPPESLFVHPKALGGILLGVSRTSVAWSWSGKPERVRRV